MAYVPFDLAARDRAFTQNPVRPRIQAKRGRFHRFLDAVMKARQRQADREIARFLQARGGRLTDEAEREIERRFLRPSSESF